MKCYILDTDILEWSTNELNVLNEIIDTGALYYTTSYNTFSLLRDTGLLVELCKYSYDKYYSEDMTLLKHQVLINSRYINTSKITSSNRLNECIDLYEIIINMVERRYINEQYMDG